MVAPETLKNKIFGVLLESVNPNPLFPHQHPTPLRIQAKTHKLSPVRFFFILLPASRLRLRIRLPLPHLLQLPHHLPSLRLLLRSP